MSFESLSMLGHMTESESGDYPHRMIANKVVEFEIDKNSNAHWSLVDSETPNGTESEEDSTASEWDSEAEVAGPDDTQMQMVRKKTNREVFENMMKHPQWGEFLRDYGDRLTLGRMIGEGGQAKIFEATIRKRDGTPSKTAWAVKVFENKPGSEVSLQGLRKQWPLGILRPKHASGLVMGATLVEPGGRFAFVMPRCWGDLRTLIDIRLQQTRGFLHQGPPFPPAWASECMGLIAHWMDSLHRAGIVHRDLKAANVLMRIKHDSDGEISAMRPWVADYECSVGVAGTLFWRAPEILLALKAGHRVSTIFSLFTEKSDVYSYGMTCYEIVTGGTPFDGILRPSNYDPVLEGLRPSLPNHVDSNVKELITKCWHRDPSERPPFAEIVKFFKEVDNPSAPPSFWRNLFTLKG